MTDPRIDQRERSSRSWFGAPQEGQLPVKADASPGGASGGTGGTASQGAAGTPSGATADTPPSAAARWRRRALRVVRDLAISIAIIAAVPLGLSMLSGRMRAPVWSEQGASNTMQKLREAEQSRLLAIPKDLSIDPAAAGRLLAAMQPEPRRYQYPTLPRTPRLVRPWDRTTMPASLKGKGGSAWGGPNSTTILSTAARGLSREELAYLRIVAEAPIWEAYDQVARAPSVDALGGRYQLPLSSRARSYTMPVWSFAATKEMAYASVSRAAYYLAIGNKAEAERVLKSTIGYGFVFIDNATSLIDALIGRVIVGIGRSALQDLYALTNDPRVQDAMRAGRDVKAPPGSNPQRLTAQEARQQQLGSATNAAVPRAIRFQQLQLLAQTVCSNPRELVFGPGKDVRDAYAQANKDLARFPSERAWLDLMLTTPSLPVDNSLPNPGPMTVRVAIGASTIASIIFDNPRMAYCARSINNPWIY